jgi:6-phosphogluconate dehydrogenase
MPGGTKASYDAIESLLTKMAAKVEDGPCVAYVGPGGSGHFVKTVHNGIEYGIEQILAEAYDLMKRVKGMNGEQMSEVFGIWNNTDELASYLVEITEICLNTKDDITGDDVVEKILDKAGQKGTGLWTVVSALELGVSVPTIYASLNARVMSSLKEQRSEIEKTIPSKEIEDFDLGNVSDGMKPLFDAVVLATIASYAQGMDILREASAVYNYGLNMPSIAQIWKGGCIIRSKLLSKIQDAYNKDPDLKNLIFDDWFNNEIATRLDNLAKVVSLSTKAGIPVPCLSSTLDYLNSYRTNRLPQNLVQAMRDCFGSHTYERIDREGSFHTEWMK